MVFDKAGWKAIMNKMKSVSLFFLQVVPLIDSEMTCIFQFQRIPLIIRSVMLDQKSLLYLEWIRRLV